MPTHKRTHTGNGKSEPERTVVIDDSVLISLRTLEADERATVDSLIHSPDRLAALAPTAYRGGKNGQLYIADASAHLMVMFRLTQKTVEVVGLLSKRAFDQLRELQAAESE
jgi:hypothetical protein